MHCLSQFSQNSAHALMTSNSDANASLWFPDSDASAHMTPLEGTKFRERSFFKHPIKVIFTLSASVLHLHLLSRPCLFQASCGIID
ncbi:unnamed protein product [Cuscuta epithymum]|uniref:Uncharacterized protein n=1 Tax=Cuscuta epithymum TaxID=186058 RepID=A0AAV0E2P6_9ASTE|nr:unnamed protein product [Cuscuta epithymum]